MILAILAPALFGETLPRRPKVAERAVLAFCEELQQRHGPRPLACTADSARDNGFWCAYTLKALGDRRCSLLVPSLEPEELRHSLVRFYVQGSSWMWDFALNWVADALGWRQAGD